MSEYSLSDMRAAMGGNCGYDGCGTFGGGGNGLLWLFAIAFLFGGGFGGIGGRCGAGSPVTEADLCNANSFNDLKSGVRDISGQISSMNTGLTKGLCDFGYTMFGQFASLERQLADFCCGIERNIDGVNYNVAQQASGIKSAIDGYAAATSQMFNAGIQSVKDMFRDYQEASLRDQNMKSYIREQMCGVVRYPTDSSYAFNANPFCGYAQQGCRQCC
jgi:hypothetical protein